MTDVIEDSANLGGRNPVLETGNWSWKLSWKLEAGNWKRVDNR
jgi:hypothetical protein